MIWQFLKKSINIKNSFYIFGYPLELSIESGNFSPKERFFSLKFGDYKSSKTLSFFYFEKQNHHLKKNCRKKKGLKLLLQLI
jgi:hypothetical protein